MADIANIAEQLGKLTVLEAAELVKKLEADWGVSAAAPVAVAAAGPAVAGPAAEEKTEFNVLLTGGGTNKIAVIKEVRTLVAGLGLADAKKAVDEAESKPYPLKEGASKAEADEIKKKLEAAGAKVEIK